MLIPKSFKANDKEREGVQSVLQGQHGSVTRNGPDETGALLVTFEGKEYLVDEEGNVTNV